MTDINSTVTGKFSGSPVIMTGIMSRFISRPVERVSFESTIKKSKMRTKSEFIVCVKKHCILSINPTKFIRHPKMLMAYLIAVIDHFIVVIDHLLLTHTRL